MFQSNQVQQSRSIDPTTEVAAAADAAGAVDLLPAPGSPGDQLAELEQLLMEMRVEERGRARLENRAEEQHIEEQGARQIDAIRDRGDAEYSQGFWTGAAQIGGGALGAYEGFTKAKEGYDQLGKVVEGTGRVWEAWKGKDVTVAEQRLAAAETAQGSAERGANAATTEMQNAYEDLRALLGALQRIHDNELAAQKAAVFIA